MNSDSHRLMRTILARLNDIEEWRLGNPALAAAKGYPRVYPAEIIDDWGLVFLDIAVEAGTGEITCHEVNGPNAVGSDALTGDSISRAENEATQATRRARDMGFLGAEGLKRPVVTVHAHQHWKFFRTGGEFFPRVDQFADALRRFMPGNDVRLREAGETRGEEDVSVVFGEVPRVALSLNVNPQTKCFEYEGRPVIFAGNPNLLAEMMRLGKLRRGYSADVGPALRVFHAGRLAPIIHDKVLQQRLLRGTGIRPQRNFEAETLEDALIKTREMLRHGPVVVKPNGTSGGAGVHVVVPGMSDAQVRQRFESLFGDCRTKYGTNVEGMIFPLRGFEFVPSTGYPMEDGGHLWDLRIAVMFEPGKAFAYPVTLRLTPKAFDPATFHDDRDQWISNVSGRQSTHLKSGMDDDALAKVGLTPEKMDLAFKASVMWTLKAWDYSVRNGGHKDTVYEDACEEKDGNFYPWQKFNV